MTSVSDTSGFDFVRVISRAFHIMVRNFPVLAVLGLVLAFLPRLGNRVADGIDDWWAVLDIDIVSFGDMDFFYFLAGVVGFAILQGAVLHAVMADQNGRRANIVSCLGTGFRLFPQALAVALLGALGVGLGMLLLIVPGLILMTIWSVALPAIIVERMRITDSFYRSAWLTNGYRWPIFGLIVVFFLVSFPLASLFNATHWAMPDWSPVTFIAKQTSGALTDLFAALMTVVAAILAASLYIELRAVKEGAGPDELDTLGA